MEGGGRQSSCRRHWPRVVIAVQASGPGDRRLLKLFRGVARRFVVPGSGRIYYHLTYIDDPSTVPPAAVAGRRPDAHPGRR